MNGETQPSSSQNGLSSNNEKKRVIRLAVGSANPAKIKAAEQAIRQTLDRKDNNLNDYIIEVKGFVVDSGVDDQPFGT